MTDKQQPPERIWMRAEILSSPELLEHFERLNKDDILYARVHPVDDARVGKIRQSIERLQLKQDELQELASSDVERAYELTINDLLGDVRYLLSRLPQLSSSELPDDVDSLHFAICQAVALMNQGDPHGGHDLLRQTLVDFADKKAPLTRSEMVRKQQRSGGGEVTTAVMVSSSERRCGECHHNNVNAEGVCQQPAWVWDDPNGGRCGHKCVFPATGAVEPQKWAKTPCCGAEPDAVTYSYQRALLRCNRCETVYVPVATTGAGEGEHPASAKRLLENVKEVHSIVAEGGPEFQQEWSAALHAFRGDEDIVTPSNAANAAAMEICDYCGIDTADGEKVAAIISKHCTVDAEEVERLKSDIERFSTLADERHDLLCAERRRVDDLRAEVASLNSDWKVMRRRWSTARTDAIGEAETRIKALLQPNETGEAYATGYNHAITDVLESLKQKDPSQ